MKKKRSKRTTKRTNEKHLISALRSGQFSRRRSPSPILHTSLSKALKKMSKITIAKEIALCLSTEPSERLRLDRYMIAQNAIPLNKWDNIAVVQTVQELNSLSDIICIDYTEYYDEEFRREETKLMELILLELKLIRRNLV